MKNLVQGFTLTTLLTVAACVDSGGNGNSAVNSDNFDFLAMLANYADSIIIPNYEALAAAAAPMAAEGGAIASYCAAIGTGEESNARSVAQRAWKDAMDAWQTSTLHELGPVLANNGAIRNRIHAYTRGTTLSSCGIDQATVLADSDPNFNLRSRSSNQRGLGAVEYLLFNDNLEHTCPSQITETSNWNERPEAERKQLRCDYAIKLSADIASAADTLVKAWLIDANNYRSQFINPSALQENLNALSDALFYLDTDTKDAKLGIPLGISAACSQVSCPSVIESPYAEYSLTNIRNNLQSFLTLLNGGSGLGFDDIIAQAGVPEVTELMQQNSATAISEID